MSAPVCGERYYPEGESWHSFECQRPAKVEALHLRRASTEGEWKPVCGIHARKYPRTRPLANANRVR